jgi:hypothetical protein
MTVAGQTRKYSLRADVVCCAPKIGHAATTATLPICAIRSTGDNQHLYQLRPAGKLWRTASSDFDRGACPGALRAPEIGRS